MTSLRLSIVTALTLFLITAGCRPGGETTAPPYHLGEEVRGIVTESLTALSAPVLLNLYRGGKGENAGRQTQALLDLMLEASPNISVVNRSYDERSGAAAFRSSLGVDHGPVIEMKGAGKGRFLYYGYPERKELPPFLDGVLMASGHIVDLPTSAEDFLGSLEKDIEIRIFATPD
jgi:hypothetical protein